MRIEENKAVVREYIRRMNQKDLSVIDELFTSNFVGHITGTDMTRNREEFKQANVNTGLPDSTRTIDDIVAEGDKVSVRETIVGTQTRKFRSANPTGKAIKFINHMIVRLEEDKIAEMWHLVDNLSIFQQLGALPPTEEIGK